MLKEKMSLSLEKVVTENDTAARVASGALEVFSTPMMIALMENASFQLIQKELDEGDTTVGISVNIKHLKANPVGDKVVATAILEKIEGKKLTLSVKVQHNDVIVGEGIHERYIVNEEKFLSKLK